MHFIIAKTKESIVRNLGYAKDENEQDDDDDNDMTNDEVDLPEIKPIPVSMTRSHSSNESGGPIMYLDGVTVYFGTGFTDQSLLNLKKIVVDGGGTRCNEYRDGFVTHYISSSKSVHIR